MPRKRKRQRGKHSPAKLRLRGQVWVESSRGAMLTESGADLLEQIEASGSLSEAARKLQYSYRRAWMLLDAMNRRWPKPLVTTATGGKRGRWRITPVGRHVLRVYRDLQLQVEHLLDVAGNPFEPHP